MNKDDDNLDEEFDADEELDPIEQAEAEDQVGAVPAEDPYFDPEVEGTHGLEDDE